MLDHNKRVQGAVERVEGIEPSYSAWKAAALPLSYTRPASTRRAPFMVNQPKQLALLLGDFSQLLP
jgi:hypothetical protein